MPKEMSLVRLTKLLAASIINSMRIMEAYNSKFTLIRRWLNLQLTKFLRIFRIISRVVRVTIAKSLTIIRKEQIQVPRQQLQRIKKAKPQSWQRLKSNKSIWLSKNSRHSRQKNALKWLKQVMFSKEVAALSPKNFKIKKHHLKYSSKANSSAMLSLFIIKTRMISAR